MTIAIGRKILEIREEFQGGSLTPEGYVTAIYQLLLNRAPEPAVLGRIQSANIDDLERSVMLSPEFAAKWHDAEVGRQGREAPQVLIFGAYGNGNLGDVAQVASLTRMIGTLRPDIELWAASVMSGRFPFRYDRTVPAARFFDPDYINRFDMLIIGGGGLFAHPHDPLISEEWQRAIDIPVALVGVGASPEVAERSSHLIGKSAFVSGRDPVSVDALGMFHPQVEGMIDPVLADMHFTACNPPPLVAGPRKVLWILKSTDLSGFRDILEQVDPVRDTICFLEPHLDYCLVLRFPDAVPVYDARRLVELIDGADLVVSFRYHGAVFALHRGKPLLGVQEPKIAALLSRYGLDDQFSKDGTTFSWSDEPRSASRAQMAADSERSVRTLQRCLAPIAVHD